MRLPVPRDKPKTQARILGRLGRLNGKPLNTRLGMVTLARNFPLSIAGPMPLVCQVLRRTLFPKIYPRIRSLRMWVIKCRDCKAAVIR